MSPPYTRRCQNSRVTNTLHSVLQTTKLVQNELWELVNKHRRTIRHLHKENHKKDAVIAELQQKVQQMEGIFSPALQFSVCWPAYLTLIFLPT